MPQAEPACLEFFTVLAAGMGSLFGSVMVMVPHMASCYLRQRESLHEGSAHGFHTSDAKMAAVHARLGAGSMGSKAKHL